MSNQENRKQVDDQYIANLIKVLAKLRRADRYGLLDKIDQDETKQFADEIVSWYDGLTDKDFKRRMIERYSFLPDDIESIRNGEFDLKCISSKLPIDFIEKNMEIASVRSMFDRSRNWQSDETLHEEMVEIEMPAGLHDAAAFVENGLDENSLETPEYNSEVPDDISEVVDGFYKDTTDYETDYEYNSNTSIQLY